MARATGDDAWLSQGSVKNLILEHHMAARRLGFEAMFEPIYRLRGKQTGLLDGTLPELAFFSRDVLPLVRAIRSGDKFGQARVVRERSPILGKSALQSAASPSAQIGKAKAAVAALANLWNDGNRASFRDVLVAVHEHRLFAIPEGLQPFTERAASPGDPDEAGDEAAEGWGVMLDSDFEQIASYSDYITGISPFDTHQSVKGREFPRVMVVISDDEARGFMFSYDKLFGAKEKTVTDIKNEADGADSSIARTRRLFYVTCSRAEESLAVLAYSGDAAAVRRGVLANGWFNEDEIVQL
jgi:DNA helicase-2/ATP-dependent DNA helicase PcrA